MSKEASKVVKHIDFHILKVNAPADQGTLSLEHPERPGNTHHTICIKPNLKSKKEIVLTGR